MEHINPCPKCESTFTAYFESMHQVRCRMCGYYIGSNLYNSCDLIKIWNAQTPFEKKRKKRR